MEHSSKRNKRQRRSMLTNTTESCQYTNWQEEMLLKQRLSVIKNNEKHKIREIYSQQRIVQRRFQSKLWNSRMLQARIAGDRELLWELRNSKQHEDVGSLKTLTTPKRPCTVPSYSLVNTTKCEEHGKISRRRTVSTMVANTADTTQTPKQQTRPFTVAATRPTHSHLIDDAETPPKISEETQQGTKVQQSRVLNREKSRPSNRSRREQRPETSTFTVPSVYRETSYASIDLSNREDPYWKRLSLFYDSLDAYKLDTNT